MAPTLREPVLSSTVEGDVTLNTGAGTAEGDLLVAVHLTDYYTAADMVPPAGSAGTWTLRVTGNPSLSNKSHIKVWTREVTAAGANSVIFDQPLDGGNHAYLAVIQAGTFNAASPINGTPTENTVTSDQTSQLAPSITDIATVDSLMISAWITGITSLTNYTAPASMTKRGELDRDIYSTSMVCTEVLAATGATGTRTATTSGPAMEYVAVSLAISPASGSVLTVEVTDSLGIVDDGTGQLSSGTFVTVIVTDNLGVDDIVDDYGLDTEYTLDPDLVQISDAATAELNSVRIREFADPVGISDSVFAVLNTGGTDYLPVESPVNFNFLAPTGSVLESPVALPAPESARTGQLLAVTGVLYFCDGVQWWTVTMTPTV